MARRERPRVLQLGDRHECKSFRGINLLSVVGKVYGRVLIKMSQMVLRV